MTPAVELSNATASSSDSVADPTELRRRGTSSASVSPKLDDRDSVLVVGHDKMPWEVTVAAAGITGDDWDAGGANAAIDVGYYFSDTFSLALRQNGSFADAGTGQPDIWNGTSRLAADLHMPLGPIVPFIGINGGVVYGDSVQESVILGPEAGARFYVKDDVFLRALVEYQFFLDKSDRVRNAFDDGQFVLGVGFGIRF
ncbi:MAG: hypothetical protein H6832_17320 [Planctomycetes bacterium]|nr:hypothetical protein [Planctomycetota bacterium]MCB9920165.1 hypothetical protein [Planctomycetota bacterium]